MFKFQKDDRGEFVEFVSYWNSAGGYEYEDSEILYITHKDEQFIVFEGGITYLREDIEEAVEEYGFVPPYVQEWGRNS